MVSVGLLARVYPARLVDEVLEVCGRVERRSRLLPARLMMYFVLGMALFSPDPYLEVMRKTTFGLRQIGLLGAWREPSKPSIFLARQRLGAEPLRELFTRAAVPLAGPADTWAFWRGLRLMAVDGTCVDLADTAANDEEFGRHGGRPKAGKEPYKRAAFPQAKIVGLVECGTHAVIDAVVSAYAVHESLTAQGLARSMGPGMLVLGDRGLPGVDLWRAWEASGADLLLRLAGQRYKLEPDLLLPDGSWITTIHGYQDRRREHGIQVRALRYQLDEGQETYTLLTTLLDHEHYPGPELAALYTERWEVETTFKELKTQQIGAGTVLASKTPDGILQQIWGHLLVHYALRVHMLEAARANADALDPDRLSFTTCLRAARRIALMPPAGFSPSSPLPCTPDA
ncbi:IS4 family transposase [Streptomyces sp. NBC_01435]|uniref:IS4 family transposase n=1 Tax=Streptomyces sp. NBC_01435 TaxID=2903865 RepID=UPI002E331B96|nr:IS4 family transposase [Streptomyces sp. NBC_01435]